MCRQATDVVPAPKRALERVGDHELERRWAHALERTGDHELECRWAHALERAGALAPDAIVAHRFVHIQSQGMAMDPPVHLPSF